LPDRRWAANALGALGAVWSLRGDHVRAFDVFGRAIDLCREAGDRYFQTWMLEGQGLEAWHMGDRDRAGSVLAETLRLSHAVDNKVGIALAIEGFAWIGASTGRAERAARLLGGVQTLWEGIPATLNPHVGSYHDSCVADARSALGDREFDRVYRDGRGMVTEELISLALEEKRPAVPSSAEKRSSAELTPREGEIAALVAEGLSNRDIASKLVISQRTAETHVEHILTKLGFTSRAQIAAWVVEEKSE
jgi:non-specific serine/threonine protein kinase